MAAAATAAQRRRSVPCLNVRLRLCVGVLVLGAVLHSAQAVEFKPGPTMLPGVIEATSVPCANKFFLVGGFEKNTDYTACNKSWMWTSPTEPWRRVRDLPQALSHSASVCLNNNTVVVMGGFLGKFPGTAVRSVWALYIPLNRWFALPSLPGPRGAGSAAILNNRIYFMGGTYGQDQASSHPIADSPLVWSMSLSLPTFGWRLESPNPRPRNHVGAVTVPYKKWLFLLGGQTLADDEYGSSLALQVFDGQSWWQGDDIPIRRSHTSDNSFEMGGLIFVFGGTANGRLGGMPLDDIIVYDLVQHKWATLPTRLPEPPTVSPSVRYLRFAGKVVYTCYEKTYYVVAMDLLLEAQKALR
eukprot:jgi/Chlat1/6395/Chrsp44S09043